MRFLVGNSLGDGWEGEWCQLALRWRGLLCALLGAVGETGDVWTDGGFGVVERCVLETLLYF